MKWKNKGHEFDVIAYQLHDKKKMIIYGAGLFAEDLLKIYEGSGNYLKQWDIQFVDRDIKKQERGFYGYAVNDPEVLFQQDLHESFIVICATQENTKAIRKTIKSNGIDSAIVYDHHYFLHTFLPIYFLYEKGILFFTSENMLPSTCCNLNCHRCLNFTPYIKKHIIEDLEFLKRDVDLFFSQVDLIYRFMITGGEPLLYPHIIEIFDYIHDNYGEKIIQLETATNGTIVPSKAQCEMFKRCNVTVVVDDYSDALVDGAERFNKVWNRLDNEGIAKSQNKVDHWIIMYDENAENITKDDEQMIKYFDNCRNPWSTLRNGKISGCNYAHYAAKAGIVEDDETNYFSLEGEVNKKELLEFRLRYNEYGFVNFCKKCGGWTWSNRNLESAALQKQR